MTSMVIEIDPQYWGKLEERSKDHRDKFLGALLLAGFKVEDHKPVLNEYEMWSRCVSTPWWRFNTNFGHIVLGWRKRVIQVDYSETGLLWTHTSSEQFTKDETYFHSWGYEVLPGLLSSLRAALEAAPKMCVFPVASDADRKR
jgi:hypothetical protein